MKGIICIFKGHWWIFQQGRTVKHNTERTLADLHSLVWYGFREDEKLFKCNRCGVWKVVAKL